MLVPMSTVAAIYARLSQDKKAGTDHEGESLEGQVKAATEWIERRGWTVGTVYRDNDISATSGANRPGFESMLQDAPPIVVYRHQDRLERGSTNELDRFLLAGCEGYGTDGSRATLASASGELMTRLQSILGKHEQRLKAERITAANLRIAESGTYRGSIRPFGQNRDGSWVPGEAEAVIEAAEKLATGEWTFFKVSTLWNERGLTTPQTGKQGGREWTSGSAKKFFTRPRLYGVQEYKGVLHPLKDWTPLLTEETFEQIQTLAFHQKTGTRKGSSEKANTRLLTNIVSCGVPGCGRGMNVGYRGAIKPADGKKPRTGNRVYRCPTSKHASVTAVPLEEYISNAALHLLTEHSGIKEEAEGVARRRAALLSERTQLVTEFNAYVEEALESGLSPSLLAKAEKKHEAKLTELDAAIGAENTGGLIGVFLRDDADPTTWDKEGERWEALDVNMRRDLIRGLYSLIEVPKLGQGTRFSPDNLNIELSQLGQSLAFGLLERHQEVTSPGRSVGPDVNRVPRPDQVDWTKEPRTKTDYDPF